MMMGLNNLYAQNSPYLYHPQAAILGGHLGLQAQIAAAQAGQGYPVLNPQILHAGAHGFPLYPPINQNFQISDLNNQYTNSNNSPNTSHQQQKGRKGEDTIGQNPAASQSNAKQASNQNPS